MNRRRSYLPIDICGIPHLHYHLHHVCIIIGLHVCITSASSLHQACIIIRPPRPSPCPSPCPSPRPSSIEGPTDTEESLPHFGASPFHVRISRDGTQKAHLTRPCRTSPSTPPLERLSSNCPALLHIRASLGRPSDLSSKQGRPRPSVCFFLSSPGEAWQAQAAPAVARPWWQQARAKWC